MQAFTRKKIALAVGAALTFGAVGAQAATAPAVRGSNPALISAVAGGVTGDMYDANKGQAANATVNLFFTMVATETLSGGADGVLVNQGTVAAPGTSDIQIYTDNGTTQTYLATAGAATITQAGGAAPATTTQAYVSFTLDRTNGAANANGAFRLNAGSLEYTTDNTASPIVWVPVKIVVNKSTAGNEWTATDAVPATAVIAASATAQAVKSAVAPTPKVTTRATSGLVDGVTINTYTPLSSLAASNVVVTTVGQGSIGSLPAIVNGTDVTASATVAGSASSWTVSFATPATVKWTASTSTDAAAYVSQYFNTGVNGGVGDLPFTVDIKDTAEPSYNEVFNLTDGTAAKLNNVTGAGAGTTPAGGIPSQLATYANFDDGAAPIVTKAEYATNDIANTNTLRLTFSEPIGLIGFDDLREVAENVLIGSDSLAAINLNNDGNLTQSLTADNGKGLGELTLTLNTTNSSTVTDTTPNLFAGKTVTVTSGIALKEPNDSGYSATTPALDSVTLADGANNQSYVAAAELAGGVKSATGAIEGATVTALATTPLAVNISFQGRLTPNGGGDTVATAQTSSTDATKVATITVKFDAGKEIGLASGKTLADLAGKIRVDVRDADAAGDNPVNWQFFPTAAQMALNTAGDTLTITIPTNLLYQQVDSPVGMNVRYLAAGETAKVLIKKGATDLTDANNVVDAGNVSVQMPLFAQGLTDTLYTENIRGAVTDAPNGSLMHAYIAKWLDKELPGKVGAADVNITSGRISIKDDKLAVDVALDISSLGTTPAATAAAAAGGATAEDVAKLVVDAFPGSAAASAAITAAGLSGATRASVIAAVAGYTQSALETAIMTELSKDKPGPITAWIHVHRSNDAVPTATGPADGAVGSADQRYLEVRAALFSSFPGNAQNKTAYEVTIDPVKGTINSARIAGLLKMTNKTAPKLGRGLMFLDADGNLTPAANSTIAGLIPVANYAIEAQGLVGAGGVFNMIVGTDAKTTAQLDNMKDTFLLLVLENPQADTANGENKFTLLTSADKDTNNFVPFLPNLISLKGEATNLSTAPSATVAAPVESLAKVNYTPVLETSSKWQLLGFASLDRKAALSPANLPRFMVGLAMDPALSSYGVPASFWSGDVADSGQATLGWPSYLAAAPADMAFSMLGSKAAVASQGANGDTVGAVNVKPNAVAFAFSDDDGASLVGVLPHYGRQLFAKGLAEDVPTGIPAGWSLVSVPTAWTTTLPPEISMIIDVGSQATTQYTWVTGDASTPTLKAGQPVFVFATTAITGK